MIKIVFLGDIVAKAGRKALQKYMPSIKAKYDPDLIIANGENAAGGLGITPETADEMFFLGVDVITTGNHVWKHKEIFSYLDSKSDKIIRPINFPISENFATPGVGYTAVKRGNIEYFVINAMGRTFMENLDCPFKSVDAILKKEKRSNQITIVDFHAETTSEKMAMGFYLDGRASAVIGTHTHVQTADERILPKGTAYITDVGMCGSMDSVIGVDKEIIIQRFITQRPVGFKFPEHSVGINGVYIAINSDTLSPEAIERISLKDTN